MTFATRLPEMSNTLDISRARTCLKPRVCLTAGGWGRAARERGQSLVELAIVLPAVVVGLLLVIGLGILGQAKAGVQAVADEAARAGALTTAPDAASAAGINRAYQVAEGYGLDPARLDVTIDTADFQRGGTLSVEVDYRVPLHDLLPMIWGGDVALRHSASEPIDRYRTFR
jgi:Flp pilus assembly protein TadG